MSIGASLQKDGQEIATVSEATGDGTNDMAEYGAAIQGLRRAGTLDVDESECV